MSACIQLLRAHLGANSLRRVIAPTFAGHAHLSPGDASAGRSASRPLKPHPKVLIVDDDPAIGRMLRPMLEGERYKVLWSRDGAGGVTQAVESRPDVIILELDLPDGDGFAVLAALREWNEAPVLILSGRAGVADKVRALEAGANDYMVKPFAPEELAARLRVLQRCEPPTSDGPLLVSGALKIDMATREVTVNGSSLELTATEEAILFILARQAGKLVPRPRLTRAIWGTDAVPKISELQVYIARLRRKLEERGGINLIRGDGSEGYSLSLTADHECATLKTS
jgi:two-component system, OmpR family, KDP operon response regulator KdpE